jgi:predicted RNase H-like nuclease (RuvC/YqgF family)
VPEISSRDLRRLEALEGRLDKERDDRKALAAERRALRAAATASARRVRALEKEASASNARLDAVLEENAALASQLEELRADLERLESAPLELRAELDSCRATLGEAQSALKKAQEELASVQSERDGLAGSLQVAQDQLAGKGIAPVLPATEVAKLVNNLVSEFGGLRGIGVRDGEVRLRVAFGKVGRTTGFVIPSAESPPELRENVHEVSVRFERKLELPER